MTTDKVEITPGSQSHMASQLATFLDASESGDKAATSPREEEGATEDRHEAADDDGQADDEDLDDLDDGNDEDVDDGDEDDGEEDTSDKLTMIVDGQQKDVTLDELLDGREFEVKVNGEVHAVPFDELKTGYMLRADHTRKTMALADERRQFDDERETLMDKDRAATQERLSALDDTVSTIKGLFGDEPDWPALARQLDPKDYQARRAAWDGLTRQISDAEAKAKAEREKLAEDASKRQEKQLERHRDMLPDLIPEWKDGKRAEKDVSAMVSMLEEAGMQAGVLSEALAANPNWLVILRDAVAFRNIKEAKGKKRRVRKATRTQRAGSTDSGNIATEQQKRRAGQKQRAFEKGRRGRSNRQEVAASLANALNLAG